MKNLCFAVLGALMAVSSVFAEDAVVAKLETFLRTPEVAAKAYTLLVADEARVTPACKDVEPASASSVSVFSDVAFDAAGKVTGGIWTARYPVKVCNKAAWRSIAYAVRDGGVMELAPMVPGASITDPILQSDTKKAFAVAVQKMIGECANIVIRDTVMVREPVKLNDPWREAWIAHACGRDAGQVLDFIPTAEGTTVKMGIAGATDGVSYTVVR